MRVAFVPREQPLTPAAAVGVGAAARRLGERLLNGDIRGFTGLRAIASSDVLLVVGDADALPWVPGIVYLGHDPDAPRLLLPTALRPDVPTGILERALFQRSPELGSPLAVLASPRRVMSAALARRIERPLLERWVSRCT